MGGGVSKNGVGYGSGPTTSVPTLPPINPRAAQPLPSRRPNPLSSTEVQQRMTTTTTTTADAAPPLEESGGDEMVPRPPMSPPHHPSPRALEGERNGRSTNHPHQSPFDKTLQGREDDEGKTREDEQELPSDTRADGEKSRKSGSPVASDHGSADENCAVDSVTPAHPAVTDKTTDQQEQAQKQKTGSLAEEEQAAAASRLSPDPCAPSISNDNSHRPHDDGASKQSKHGKADTKDDGEGDAFAYRSNARSVSPAMPLTTDYGALPLTQLQSELRGNHRVLRVCLTGGPCAGKSTMLAEIQAKIPQRTGYQVFCVPEAATLLVTGGMKWDADITLEQQLCLLRTQLALEDQFYALAMASGKPTVVMSDRGTMDGRAFCPPETFAEILRRLSCSLDVLRDRYDAVIHMVTAACGAEAYYNLDNPARYEDLDGARASDQKLQQMYVGHPMFRLLDNSTTFDQKIERGLQLVSRLVGQDGAAMQRTSYFLIRNCPMMLPVPCATFRVRTVVLGNSQMDEMRLVQLRIMADGSRMHFFKSVRKAHAQQQTSPLPPTTGNSRAAFPRTGAGGSQPDGDATRESSSASSDGTRKPTQYRRNSIQLPTPATRSRSSTSVHSHANATPFYGCPGNLLGQSASDYVTNAVRISSKEYRCLVKNRDLQREIVEAEATHFIYAGANFEVTTILAPSWAAGKQTLTVEYDAESHTLSEEAKCLEDGGSVPDIPEFIEVDREVPLDSTTITFLISHRETGPLYTSLAFAPVFSPQYRGSVAAIGPHADVENFFQSTQSTPKRNQSLRSGPAGLVASAHEKRDGGDHDERIVKAMRSNRTSATTSVAASPFKENADAEPPQHDANDPSAATANANSSARSPAALKSATGGGLSECRRVNQALNTAASAEKTAKVHAKRKTQTSHRREKKTTPSKTGAGAQSATSSHQEEGRGSGGERAGLRAKKEVLTPPVTARHDPTAIAPFVGNA